MNRIKIRTKWMGSNRSDSKRSIEHEEARLKDLQSELEEQRKWQHIAIQRIHTETKELQKRHQETLERIDLLHASYLVKLETAAAAESPALASPLRMGDQLVHNGLITEAQLSNAMIAQRNYGGRLGEILIDMGFLTREQLDHVVQDQPVKGKLGDLLVNEHYLSSEQLDQALEFQSKSGGLLGDVLLSLQLIEPEILYRVIATQNNIGRIGEELSINTPVRLPEQIARSYEVVVIHQYINRFLVAVSQPLTTEQQQEIVRQLGSPIEQVLATKNEMEHFWKDAYSTEMLHESTSKLADEQPHNSAIKTFTRVQLHYMGLLALAFIVGMIFNFWKTVIIANMIIQVFYFIMTLFKFTIIMMGSRRDAQFRFTPEEIEAIDERNLPIYTILVPMYRESRVLPSLLRNLERIDYPKAKLDVRLLIEEDDDEMRAMLTNMKLPAHYTVLIVPDGLPKTKPKACNFGLIRARGEYVVIYDAEDQPDPDQLKKVYLTFKKNADEVACVQAKLNYFNSDQNLLTKWFTQEYSMWFELLLPGIMQLDIPIPLGGTSNHFKMSALKELGAWDPYNVTEDADLGIRLYKHGYKTAIVDSRTWEEANSRFGNWIRQRSRWIKGYMQTWLVHMRNPFQLYREIGFKGFVGFQVMVLATPVIPILNPIFWLLVILWYIGHFSFIPLFFPGYIYYLAAGELFIANFFFVYSNIVGVYWVINDLEKRGQTLISYSLVKYAILTPLYWAMMSIAAYKALWQLITNPFYWEKTTHGLHIHDNQNESDLSA